MATLTGNKRRAIGALLSHATAAKAAEACGLGHRTVVRYLADPDFRRELRQQQDAILAAVAASLVGMAGESIQTLRDILQSKSASDAVKCRAALGWLAQTRQAVELADLAARIAELERLGGHSGVDPAGPRL